MLVSKLGIFTPILIQTLAYFVIEIRFKKFLSGILNNDRTLLTLQVNKNENVNALKRYYWVQNRATA